jgi:uncharacterized protein Yka (UPF0111/DUF47 family)
MMVEGGDEMAMESVLKTVEDRIDELVKAYQKVNRRAEELAARVVELEQQLESGGEQADRVTELESQRDALRERLEKVLGTLDEALGSVASGDD